MTTTTQSRRISALSFAPMRRRPWRAAATLALAPAAHADDNQYSLWQSARTTLPISGTRATANSISGVAHHGRSTYSTEKLNELNDTPGAWATARPLRNDKGDDESLYGFVIKDSHRHPQYMAGYAYEWVFRSPRPGWRWAWVARPCS
jgi:palmitoyl transferase